MGLNPPFGVKASLANNFVNHALKFKPKLLVLIVPKEAKRYTLEVYFYYSSGLQKKPNGKITLLVLDVLELTLNASCLPLFPLITGQRETEDKPSTPCGSCLTLQGQSWMMPFKSPSHL